MSCNVILFLFSIPKMLFPNIVHTIEQSLSFCSLRRSVDAIDVMLVLLTCFVLTLYYSVIAEVQVPRKLLNDGNTIPILALGTFVGIHDVPRIRQTINWAIEAGYRHIDTAAIYMNEGQIGLGIKDVIKKGLVKREELFITTKLKPDSHYRDLVVVSLRGSLSRLGLDYVDLFLIHTPISSHNIDVLETWQGMEQAQRLGLTKSIGVSNFNIEQINRIVTHGNVRPAVNQIEVHPASTREALVAHCQSLDITVTAYSPFGFLVHRGQSAYPPAPPYMDDPTLMALARKYGKMQTQIVLRYLIERGLIPIPKSTNQHRIRENIDIFDFSLTKEEVEIINNFNSNNAIFGWP